MLTIKDAINGGVSNIRIYINQQLTARLITELGYTWSDERIERVAQSASKYFVEGAAIGWSMAQAIEDEIVLYGER